MWGRKDFDGSSPAGGGGGAAAATTGVEVEAEDCGGGHIEERSEVMKASITDALSSVQRFMVGAN